MKISIAGLIMSNLGFWISGFFAGKAYCWWQIRKEYSK